MTPAHSHQSLLAQLLPPVAYEPQAPRLAAQLQVMGAQLDTAQADADTLLDASSPLTCAPEFLGDWERVLGLPFNALLNTQDRRARCVLKIRISPARLERQWFVDLAAGIGYEVSVDERTVFWLDASPMDATGMGGEGDQFVWDVRLVNQGLSIAGSAAAYLPGCGLGLTAPIVTTFNLDSSAMDSTPFIVDTNATLQSLFAALKPAHTQVSFIN